MPYQETPRKSHSTSESAYQARNLETRRSALLEGVPFVPEIQFERLVGAVLAKRWRANDSASQAESTDYLPRSLPMFQGASESLISDEIITQTIETLKANQTLGATGRWTGVENNPEKSVLSEFATFKALEPLFDAIVEASPYATSNPLILKVDGRTAPASDSRFDTALADGWLILKKSTLPNSVRAVEKPLQEPPRYLDNFHDIPVVFEFKKEDNERNLRDVCSHLLSLVYAGDTDATLRSGRAQGLVVNAPLHAK